MGTPRVTKPWLAVAGASVLLFTMSSADGKKPLSNEQLIQIVAQHATAQDKRFSRENFPRVTVHRGRKEIVVAFQNRIRYSSPSHPKRICELSETLTLTGEVTGGTRDSGDRFQEPTPEQDLAVAVLDRALRKNGNLRSLGDLSRGVTALEQEFIIDIEEGESLSVRLNPVSGAGHDFSFSVDKKTLELLDVAVGEIRQRPR